MIKLFDILFEDAGCCSRPKAPILLESAGKALISEHLQYHIQNKLPLTENTFRYGSKSFMSLWNEARELHKSGIILLEGNDKAIIEETEIGKFAIYEGKIVPLDLILEYESEEQSIEDEPITEKAKPKKKNPPLNKPKRGGSKKFYVYVRNPKTKKVKKVSFGAPGMSVGFRDPKRRKAFAARHKCAQKTDRTKPSYWSCRVGRYAKQLGMGNNFSGFW